MSEETTTGTVVTFDDVVGKHSVLAGLPELVAPNRVKPLVGARIQTVSATVEAMFGYAQDEAKDDAERGVAFSNAMEQALGDEEPVMRSLAVDGNAFDEWELGRNPVDLTLAYFDVLHWYLGELGK